LGIPGSPSLLWETDKGYVCVGRLEIEGRANVPDLFGMTIANGAIVLATVSSPFELTI